MEPGGEERDTEGDGGVGTTSSVLLPIGLANETEPRRSLLGRGASRRPPDEPEMGEPLLEVSEVSTDERRLESTDTTVGIPNSAEPRLARVKEGLGGAKLKEGEGGHLGKRACR